jgi:hypothetical protein
VSPLPPSLQGLPTGKLIGSGGAVTPAAVGPPTVVGRSGSPALCFFGPRAVWPGGSESEQRTDSRTMTGLPTGASDRSGMTPLLLRSPFGQAHSQWNSGEAWVVKDGRKGLDRLVPCYRLLLTIDGLLEKGLGDG